MAAGVLGLPLGVQSTIIADTVVMVLLGMNSTFCLTCLDYLDVRDAYQDLFCHSDVVQTDMQEMDMQSIHRPGNAKRLACMMWDLRIMIAQTPHTLYF